MNEPEAASEWHELVLGHVSDGFSTSGEVHESLASAVQSRFGTAAASVVGRSEEGRPIHGFSLGRGAVSVSLLAGHHADEPVGPETLRALLSAIVITPDEFTTLLDTCTFRIVPHCNPDGEARNQPWIRKWPSIDAFIRHSVREEPGRDLEFGYPDLRRENRAVGEFLRQGAPFDLHMSLHGMAFSQGALLLIDRRNAPHAGVVRWMFRRAVDAAGLRLHDENRAGEKGFFYLEPGFWTTPEGSAMRDHFEIIGQPDVAAHFRNSSMEHVHALGGTPLSLVTEVPLFELATSAPDDLLPRLRAFRRRDSTSSAAGNVENELASLTNHVPVRTAVQLHLSALDGGLAYVEACRRVREAGSTKS